jgi:uncharacterized protein (TIGR00299 family) protein
MSDSRFAIIDPAAGISGDMLLGALVDLGAGEDWIRTLPARLGCPEVEVTIAKVGRCGILSTQVQIRLPGGVREQPAAPVEPHDHRRSEVHGGHSHGHATHRHLGELLAMVERAPLSEAVRVRALRAFRLLGEAEGRVHGVPAEQVALHEVGALDALVDIVGCIEGFEQLGVSAVYSWPLVLGSGWVRAAHGTMAIPAPATGILIEGLEVGPDGPVTGEATTPTGAALLRALSQGRPPARWRGVASGWGAGGRDPAEYPNALRVMIAEPTAEAGEVVVTVTDLDDLSPEYLEPLREALIAAGALDVQVWASQAKKGRPGFRIEVVSEAATAAAVTEALFRHSSTIGVRQWTAERVTLTRRQIEVETREGIAVRVKVVEGPGGTRVKPEFEDVARAARRTGRPAVEVAREVQQRAQDRVASETRAPLTANKES